MEERNLRQRHRVLHGKWLAERRIARQHRRDNEVARAHRRAAQAAAEEEERAREEEAAALRARLLANPIAEGIARVQHGEERRTVG